MKKLVALMLAIALCASLAAIPAAMADETIKITIFVDGTIPDQANGRDEFEARWEELHPGFDLDIIQPDHSSYAQNLQQRLADNLQHEGDGCRNQIALRHGPFQLVCPFPAVALGRADRVALGQAHGNGQYCPVQPS